MNRRDYFQNYVIVLAQMFFITVVLLVIYSFALEVVNEVTMALHLEGF